MEEFEDAPTGQQEVEELKIKNNNYWYTVAKKGNYLDCLDFCMNWYVLIFIQVTTIDKHSLLKLIPHKNDVFSCFF